MERLLTIMKRLRDPATGCEWDVAQSFESIAPYTIEEAHEVADAIARGDMAELKDELGDLLLQVIFHAQIAEDLGHFAFLTWSQRSATRWSAATRTSSAKRPKAGIISGSRSRRRNVVPRRRVARSMVWPWGCRR